MNREENDYSKKKKGQGWPSAGWAQVDCLTFKLLKSHFAQLGGKATSPSTDSFIHGVPNDL